jgi:undecaprenyl diphosphate synthase
LVAEGIRPEDITEEAITKNLDTGGMPDPDLIIRTAGEMRLSNFLLWQAAYAEYYSTPTTWPDFDKDAFYEALAEYSRRHRKFGGILPHEHLEYDEVDQGTSSDTPKQTQATRPDPAAVK